MTPAQDLTASAGSLPSAPATRPTAGVGYDPGPTAESPDFGMLLNTASQDSSEAIVARSTASSPGSSTSAVEAAKRTSPSNLVWNGWIARAMEEWTWIASRCNSQ